MIKYCPICGSTEIYLWMGGNAGMVYRCKVCGYIGPVVLEKVVKGEKNSDGR